MDRPTIIRKLVEGSTKRVIALSTSIFFLSLSLGGYVVYLSKTGKVMQNEVLFASSDDEQNDQSSEDAKQFGWGASLSGEDTGGNWAVSSADTLEQMDFGSGWYGIWYGDKLEDNYKVTLNAKWEASGFTSKFPKFGAYACYQDSSNYVSVWFDKQYKALATYGMVGGKPAEWLNSDLSDLDFTKDNEIKVIKIGSKFKFYVNGKLKQSRNFNISSGQIGLVTEDTKANFTKVTLTTGVTEFDAGGSGDPTVYGFGASHSGSDFNGDWQAKDESTISQMELGNGWRQIFFGDIKSSYKLVTNVKWLGQGKAEFPKYGVYAAYKDKDNFVTMFLDKKYKALATNARVNGMDLAWQNADLSGVDFNQANELKVIKIGSTFKFYVNKKLVQVRKINIDSAQPGLLTEDTKAEYTKLTYSDAKTFDPSIGGGLIEGSIHGWGKSITGVYPSGSGWQVYSADSVDQFELGSNFRTLFYGTSYLDNYKVTAKIKHVATGKSDPFPKYGIYAAYKNDKNFVAAFLDVKYGLATWVSVNGKDSWLNFPIDFIKNFDEYHEVKVIKIGSEFRFYVDGRYVGKRIADIDKGQIALSCVDTKASYRDIAVQPTTVFDPDTHQGEESNFGWGTSISGMPESGEWIKESATSLASNSFGNGFRSTFTGGYRANYVVSSKIQHIATGNTDPFPKYGLFACYVDGDNYVAAFIDKKYGLATQVRVNGAGPDGGPEWINLPADFSTNYNEPHEIKVAKVNNEFRFYVDGKYVGKRMANISKGQIGLVTEDTKAKYTEIQVKDISSFDDAVPPVDDNSSFGWGSAKDGTPSNGTWTINSASDLLQSGFGAGFISIFNGELKDNYRIAADVEWKQTGTTDSFPKYGVYAVYKDANNYVAGFIDQKYGFATQVVTNGNSTWNNTPIDFVTDYKIAHQIKAIKLGNKVKFYVDGKDVTTVTTAIDKGQYGLVTVDSKVQYKNVTVSDTTAFDPSSTGEAVNGWGDAADSTPKSGTWADINSTGLSQTMLGGNANIFGGELKANYKFITNIAWKATGTNDPFPKYGIYAEYKDSNNFVEMYLDTKYGFVSHVKANGIEQDWLNTPVPQGFDFAAKHELKAIKLGKTVQLYLDGILMQSRDADIDQAQVGLRTIDTRVDYTDMKIDTAASFDPTVKTKDTINDWGDATNGGQVAPGTWSVEDNGNKVTKKDFDSTFVWPGIYTGKLLSDYTVSVDTKLLDRTGNYPKVGMYAAYKNIDNYLAVFFDLAANNITTYGKVHGQLVRGSNGSEWIASKGLPEGFNYSDVHNLKVVKSGSTFTIFVDGEQYHQVTYDIDMAQAGLMTETTKAEFTNFNVNQTMVWGDALNGTKKDGDWTINEDGTIAVNNLSNNPLPRIFAQSADTSYNFIAKVKEVQRGTTEFPKYGIVAGYTKENKQIRAFIDPKHNCFVTHADDQDWENTDLPAGFDPAANHEIKVIRIGKEFAFYLDGVLMHVRTFQYANAETQVGLTTEDTRAVYSDVRLMPASSFDATVVPRTLDHGFGDAVNGNERSSGWIVSADGKTLSRTQADGWAGGKGIFYGPMGANGTVYTDITALNDTMPESYKIGLYPIYNNIDNYILVFLDSWNGGGTCIVGRINGQWINWDNGQVRFNDKTKFPNGYDWKQKHTLKTQINGANLEVYVDGVLVQTKSFDFNNDGKFDIAQGQAGFYNENVQAKFENINITK